MVLCANLKTYSAVQKTMSIHPTRSMALRITIAVIAAVGLILALRSFAVSDGTAASVLEAERMNISGSTASVVTDGTATGGQGVTMQSNGTIGTLASLPAGKKIKIRAKATPCQGDARMNVSLDGTQILSVGVGAKEWANYSVAQNISPGDHALSISFSNAGTKGSCSRTLSLDSISIMK